MCGGAILVVPENSAQSKIIVLNGFGTMKSWRMLMEEGGSEGRKESRKEAVARRE